VKEKSKSWIFLLLNNYHRKINKTKYVLNIIYEGTKERYVKFYSNYLTISMYLKIEHRNIHVIGFTVIQKPFWIYIMKGYGLLTMHGLTWET